MQIRTLAAAGTVLTAWLAAPAMAVAQAGCLPQDLAALPSVGPAIAGWADQRGVSVPPSAAQRVGAEFCAGAKVIAEERRMRLSDIDRVAARVVPEYLDIARDLTRPGRPMETLIEVQLGSRPGLSPPVGKLYGFIRLTASPPLTGLRLNGEAVQPRASVMFQVGQVAVLGYRGNQEACRAQVEVQVGAETSVAC